MTLLPLLRMAKINRSQKETNIDLWNKILKGELSGLEQLYTLYYYDLFNYALKIVNQKDLAEDAVQDVFIDLWNYRKQLGNINAPKFYLIRSVRNQCLKILKKQQRFTDLSDASPFEITIFPEELQIKDNSAATKTAIEQTMAKLSPRQKEIIYLKFYNNLDYEELAEILDINYQSVVNHIHKAMIKLRQANILDHFKH